MLEWVFRDALGNDIPCEVRWVRLQSGDHRLIRGSITDITERKRTELLTAGERRVFERLAANVDLRITLEAITDVVERVAPDAVCAIRLLDEHGMRLKLCAGPRMPAEYARAMEGIAVAARNGSCAAAVYLQRQVIVADIARDALWENVREAVLAAGLRSCWSTLIHASDGRILGTLALYFRTPRSPQRRDFELMARMTQLAGIAIERRMAESALRASEARYRRLFDNVMEGVYSSTREGRFLSVNPALARMVGFSSPAELLSLPTETIYHNPLERAAIIAALERDGEVRNAEFQLRRVDGTTLTVIESARAVRDDYGKLIGYEGTISDISERKRAETAVFEEKEKAQVTLQSIGDAVITTDAKAASSTSIRSPRISPAGSRARPQGKLAARSLQHPQRSDARAARGSGDALAARGHGDRRGRSDRAGQSSRPGDRDPGFGGADPRSSRQDHRRGHGVP